MLPEVAGRFGLTGQWWLGTEHFRRVLEVKFEDQSRGQSRETADRLIALWKPDRARVETGTASQALSIVSATSAANWPCTSRTRSR